MLFVGRLVPVKGLDRLLQALSLVGGRFDWSLDVLGEGPCREPYVDLCRHLGLGDRVRFQGWTEPREVARFLASADFLVVPSVAETFSCATLEALACGRPVVGAIEAVGELVGSTEGVLAQSAEPPHLAEAIVAMAGRRFEFDRARLVAQARAYSLESIGGLLTHVYRDSLAGAARTGA